MIITGLSIRFRQSTTDAFAASTVRAGPLVRPERVSRSIDASRLVSLPAPGCAVRVSSLPKVGNSGMIAVSAYRAQSWPDPPKPPTPAVDRASVDWSS